MLQMLMKLSRILFIKYQDRILFGTDIGAKALLVDPSKGIEMGESHERVYLVRNFLENEGEFTLNPDSGFLFGKPDKPFHGLGLPESVLDKIYFRNFEKIVGDRPRPVNPAAVLELCSQVDTMIQLMGSSQPGVPGDPSVDVLMGVDPLEWDLAKTKQVLGGKVCLWGGVNGQLTVERGSEDDVRGEVKKAVETLAPGSGFILSPVDNIRIDDEVSRVNVGVLVDEWKRLEKQG